MKVLLDTNIILDIVLEREPYVEQAVHVLENVQKANIALYLTATTVTDLYYITCKARGRAIAWNFITDLIALMHVAGVDETVIKEALRADWVDFEDAVQESAARKETIQVIVTRNKAGFKNSTLEVYDPESFLHILRTAC